MLMRSGDDPHIHLDVFVVTDTLQFSAFDEAQQLGLQAQWHLANLIEKQSSAIGGLNSSNAPLHRSRKCAARMTKKLRLQKRLRNGCTVDGDKRFSAARGELVQGFRN